MFEIEMPYLKGSGTDICCLRIFRRGHTGVFRFNATPYRPYPIMAYHLGVKCNRVQARLYIMSSLYE